MSLGLTLASLFPDHLTFAPVIQHPDSPAFHKGKSLAGVGERHSLQCPHLVFFVEFAVDVSYIAVDVIECEERFFDSCLHIDFTRFLHVEIHQLVAPPCSVKPLGDELPIVYTAKVEFLEGKLL